MQNLQHSFVNLFGAGRPKASLPISSEYSPVSEKGSFNEKNTTLELTSTPAAKPTRRHTSTLLLACIALLGVGFLSLHACNSSLSPSPVFVSYLQAPASSSSPLAGSGDIQQDVSVTVNATVSVPNLIEALLVQPAEEAHKRLIRREFGQTGLRPRADCDKRAVKRKVCKSKACKKRAAAKKAAIKKAAAKKAAAKRAAQKKAALKKAALKKAALKKAAAKKAAAKKAAAKKAAAKKAAAKKAAAKKAATSTSTKKTGVVLAAQRNSVVGAVKQILASGAAMAYGGITNTIYDFQSSGLLSQGGCIADAATSISDCYHLHLDATGNVQRRDLDFDGTAHEALEKRSDDRQRIEILSNPPAPAGESWTYGWSYYLSTATGTNDHFFHLAQLLSRGEPGGPILTLSAIADQVYIDDNIRNVQSNKISLSSFAGITTSHSLSVTYGNNGRVSYTIKNAGTGQTILSYSASGDMGDQGSVKFGLYRELNPGITAADAYVGDLTSKQQ